MESEDGQTFDFESLSSLALGEDLYVEEAQARFLSVNSFDNILIKKMDESTDSVQITFFNGRDLFNIHANFHNRKNLSIDDEKTNFERLTLRACVSEIFKE